MRGERAPTTAPAGAGRPGDWQPDVLGEGWERLTLPMGHDTDGPVVATLVRASREHLAAVADGVPVDRAVLYVHGFNDYFFQTHLATEWVRRGYDFHAVDLRRCGRSWREGQMPHFVADLAEHAADLTAAARVVLGGRDGVRPERLVVLAHSTGGLTASLWTHGLRRAGVVDALVLNSPWFDLNARWFRRVVTSRVASAVGPVRPLDPLRVVASGPSAYSHHLHVRHGGRWTYDLRLKPPDGVPVRAGWLRAIRRGQARVAQGLQIGAPVLVCTSAATGPNRADNPDLDRQDTVLDVAQIAARAPSLGPDVTLAVIPDGIHDLALSADVPRQAFVDAVFSWLERVLPR